ncbi:hypothetical protein BN946_scf184884.g64 [Trametes cinnabarina]|uniref:Uncharacterized protein n=1 Tax=Pycnoporus cinnabarinus TaxID=5643 RepID=A0A060S6C9_PYCCI|nr:hypothetical protein BN946_scf184884.g64 [Trametes cinnabarina]
MTVDSKPAKLSPENVPLRAGPPTREEMLVYYPAKFTWKQLKTFVNSGDLGLLKRDKRLQKRYEAWAAGIREKYGSMANFLLNYRLQWGKEDTITLLRSSLDDSSEQASADLDGPAEVPEELLDPKVPRKLPPLPPNAPPYFKADMPRELYCITMNDWPYSVPPEVEHSLIWSRVPILPPDLPPPSESRISARLYQDGLWGFTGSESPPPSPSILPESLGALSEWGVTMDKLIRSPRGTEEEERELRKYGEEIEKFIKRRWHEREWETAWFVNPPRLQSVPELTHIHVFARRKTPEEIARAQINSSQH